MNVMENILGQDRAIDVLQSGLASGRLHHAYVFHGPAGVGKFTCALAFARVLLCHAAQPDLTGRITACGTCPSCKLLRRDPAAASHPDLSLIYKELARDSLNPGLRERKLMNIPLDVIREHMVGGTTGDDRYHEPAIGKTAALGHGKVFVIDEAELLAHESQNTLLKTLEEPPAGTYLILVTSAEDKLLPTIRSRCQRVPFAPLSDRIISQWLQREAPDLPEAGRQWLINFVAGSLGRAQLVLAYDLSDWADVLLPALREMAGGRYPIALGEQMAQMVDDFAKRWVNDHFNASKEAANKHAAALMWSMISQHVRQRLRQLADTCDPADPLGAEQRLGPWLAVLDALHQAEWELAANVRLGLVTGHLVAVMFRALKVPSD